MKQKWSIVALVAVVVSSAYGGYGYNSIPTFTSKAETRLTAFLGYSYGPGKCKAIQSHKNHWDMTCRFEDGQRVLTYALYPPEKAPYEVAEGFYLVALNESAKKSARQGLVKYLNIDTRDAIDSHANSTPST